MIHMGFSGAVAFFLVRVFKVCYAIFGVVLYFGNILLFLILGPIWIAFSIQCWPDHKVIELGVSTVDVTVLFIGI